MALRDKTVDIFPIAIEAGESPNLSQAALILRDCEQGPKGELVKRTGLSNYQDSGKLADGHIASFAGMPLTYGEQIDILMSNGDWNTPSELGLCTLDLKKVSAEKGADEQAGHVQVIDVGGAYLTVVKRFPYAQQDVRTLGGWGPVGKDALRVYSYEGQLLGELTSVLDGTLRDIDEIRLVKLATGDANIYAIARSDNGKMWFTSYATLFDTDPWTQIGTVSDCNGIYDAVAVDGTYVAIAYQEDNSGTPQYAMMRWQPPSGFTIFRPGDSGANGEWAATVFRRGVNEVVYAFVDSGIPTFLDVKARAFDLSTGAWVGVRRTVFQTLTVAGTGEHVMSLCGVRLGGDDALIYVNTWSATLLRESESCNNVRSWKTTFPYASGSDGGTPFIVGAHVAGKPFNENGDDHMLSIVRGGYQVYPAAGSLPDNLGMLIKSTGEVLARYLVGVTSIWKTFDFPGVLVAPAPPDVFSSSDNGGYVIPAIYRNIFDVRYRNADVAYWFLGEDTRVTSGVAAEPVFLRYTPDAANVKAVEVDGRLLIGGALGYVFDGRDVFENGFLGFPAKLETNIVAGGGVDTGLHYYTACWAVRDRYNNVYRSPPALPVEAITTGGNNKVELHIPSCTVTRVNNAGSIVLEVYRTLTDGSTFHKVTEIENDRLRRDVLFTDVNADDQIDTAAILYVDGGSADNGGVQPYYVDCIHQGRHFTVDGENPDTTIFLSQPVIPGRGPEYNRAMSINIPGDGGPITALASYLDSLLIFKENRIYLVSGSGPDRTGFGATYSPARLLHSGWGCKQQRTIAQAPPGLFIDTGRGIHMLNNQLQLFDVGDPIQYFYDQTEIASATIVPDRHHVIFVTGSDDALVYNYKYNSWSLFTNHNATDSVLVNGKLHLKVNDAILYEARGSFEDDLVGGAEPVHLVIRVGWLRFAGLNGVQFVRGIWIRGHSVAPTDLRLRVAYNDPKWIDDDSFDTSELDQFSYEMHYGTLPTSDKKSFVLRYANSVHECDRIMVEISEDTQASGTQGVTISGISMQVALEAGLKRLEDARRIRSS